jgi:hypothetical protein
VRACLGRLCHESNLDPKCPKVKSELFASDSDVYAVDSPFRRIVLGMSEAQQEQVVVLLFGDGSWRYYRDGDDVSVTDGEHPVALVWEEGDVAEELTGVIGWARAQFVEEPGPNLRS